MKITGQLLKDKRESLGLSLSEVSVSTKINTRILTAIEEGIKEDLPPLSFLKGFVRTYSKFLKLDSEEVMRNFIEELNADDSIEQPAVPQATPAPTRTASTPPSQKKLPSLPFLRDASIASRTFAVVGIILLIGIIISVKQLIDKYEKEGRIDDVQAQIENLPEQEEKEIVATEDLKEEVTEKISPPKEETKKPEVKKEQKVVEEKPKKEEVDIVKRVQSMSGPLIVNQSKPEKDKAKEEAERKAKEEAERKKQEIAKREKEEAERKAKEEAERKAQEETKKEVAEKKPAKSFSQEIIIEALDKVTVRYRIDDMRSKSIDLKPEQIYRIKAAKTVSLVFSDGGVINIIHNGKDRGVPGDIGKPYNIKFP
jgi:cytoskeleton protein RodZ